MLQVMKAFQQHISDIDVEIGWLPMDGTISVLGLACQTSLKIA